RVCGLPRPEIAEVAVMEIVGDVGADVGSQARGVEPSLLRPIGKRRRCAKGIAREGASDVHLVLCGSMLIEVVVGGVEVPLGAKVVVDAGHAKVSGLRQSNIPDESEFVHSIATRTAADGTASGRSSLGFVLLPHGLNRGIDSDTARIVVLDVVIDGLVGGIVK